MIGDQLHLLVFLVELQVQFLLLFSELEAWESGFMFFESLFLFYFKPAVVLTSSLLRCSRPVRLLHSFKLNRRGGPVVYPGRGPSSFGPSFRS